MIPDKRGEYPVQWKCPYCGHEQHDSVHPQYGPFISSTCGECGRVSHDDQLDPQSLASWEAARTAAEKENTQ
jgi:uncharacterized Zn finger protein